MYPEHVSLDWNLGGHFVAMHSPQEATEYAGYMPTVQVEAA
jgi:hypothetical protein